MIVLISLPMVYRKLEVLLNPSDSSEWSTEVIPVAPNLDGWYTTIPCIWTSNKYETMERPSVWFYTSNTTEPT